MLYATIGQWRVFLFMALAGAGAGCWYGLILRTGRLMVPGPWLHALLDLFSALGIWIILTWALLAANYGQPRAYALAAAALGFAAQRLTLAPLVSWILRLLGRVSGWVVVAISRPVWVKNIFR